MQEIVSKLRHYLKVAMLFTLNLGRSYFLRLMMDLDLVLCIGFYLEYKDLFLCLISSQRPNDQQIERRDI